MALRLLGNQQSSCSSRLSLVGAGVLSPEHMEPLVADDIQWQHRSSAVALIFPQYIIQKGLSEKVEGLADF